MNNQTARERLELAVQLREASERHLEISREFDDQATAINREVEAHYEAKSYATDPFDDERDRPASLEVMDRRETPRFDRLATALAEQHDLGQSEQIRRRPAVADTGVVIIRRTYSVEKPGIWTRIANWWAERSSERSLPAGW